MLAALGVLAFYVVARQSSTPQITTDAYYYPPFSTVYMTGTGMQPDVSYDIVTVRPDGTLSGGGLTGQWTCSGGRVIMVWSHGFTDRLTLSADGTHLAGTNGFTRVFGDRR